MSDEPTPMEVPQGPTVPPQPQCNHWNVSGARCPVMLPEDRVEGVDADLCETHQGMMRELRIQTAAKRAEMQGA